MKANQTKASKASIKAKQEKELAELEAKFKRIEKIRKELKIYN